MSENIINKNQIDENIEAKSFSIGNDEKNSSSIKKSKTKKNNSSKKKVAPKVCSKNAQSKDKKKIKINANKAKKEASSSDNISFGPAVSNMMDMMKNIGKPLDMNNFDMSEFIDTKNFSNNLKKYFEPLGSVGDLFDSLKHPGFNTSKIGQENIKSLIDDLNNIFVNGMHRAQHLVRDSFECFKEQYESGLLASDPMERMRVVWDNMSAQANRASSFCDESVSDIHKLQMSFLATSINGLPYQNADNNMSKKEGTQSSYRKTKKA